MAPNYRDYQIANIRLLASTICANPYYHGVRAAQLIRECKEYEPGDGSAFDGLMLDGVAHALINEIRHTPLWGYGAELAGQIA